MIRRGRTLYRAVWRLIDDGGFSMASAVAYSFLLSLFPFCIFLAALAGTLGGRELADAAIAQLFQMVPETVAQALAPEVEKVMGHSQYRLLTLGAAIALFFATSAIESLRAALNVAYGVAKAARPALVLYAVILFVFATAAGMLAIAWGVVVGPALVAAAQLGAEHLAARPRPALADLALHHRRGHHAGTAAGLSPVARRRPAQPLGRLARRAAFGRAVDRSRPGSIPGGSPSATTRSSTPA